jgi:ABC-type multidrug transport system ATPase subunit
MPALTVGCQNLFSPGRDETRLSSPRQVRETLRYAAILRLRGLAKSQKEARAEDVLRMMGLKTCADNLVGSEILKGISGGEKRRLSLAIALLSDPVVLIVDEPTSGLSQSRIFSSCCPGDRLDWIIRPRCLCCAQRHGDVRGIPVSTQQPLFIPIDCRLRDIALTGVTVISTIHQPRSELWPTFDSVFLLARGGRLVYGGPRAEVLDAFSAAGEPCPQDWNPADFLVDSISVDYRSLGSRQESQDRVTKLIHVWELSSGASELESRGQEKQPMIPKSVSRYKVQSMRVALPIVIARSFK